MQPCRAPLSLQSHRRKISSSQKLEVLQNRIREIGSAIALLRSVASTDTCKTKKSVSPFARGRHYEQSVLDALMSAGSVRRRVVCCFLADGWIFAVHAPNKHAEQFAEKCAHKFTENFAEKRAQKYFQKCSQKCSPSLDQTRRSMACVNPCLRH